MRVCWPIVLLFAGCGGDSSQIVNQGGGVPTDKDPDTTPPVIQHVPIDESQPFQEPVTVEATVTDEDGLVFVVEVDYRREDSTVWNSKGLKLVDPETGLYSGEIPGEDVQSGGMYYYLFAMDDSGNESWDPEDGEDDAHQFRVDGDR